MIGEITPRAKSMEKAPILNRTKEKYYWDNYGLV